MLSKSALTNVMAYSESVGDHGIVPVARYSFFASISAGAAMLVMWDAHFRHEAPDKHWCNVGGDNKDFSRLPGLGPSVPISITIVWTPNPAYASTHGKLPFPAPYWKILAIILAVIAAALGSGEASFSVGSSGEGTEPEVPAARSKGPSPSPARAWPISSAWPGRNTTGR